MSREPSEFQTHPAPFPGGSYRAVCRHVIDGDTVDVLIDLGFNQYTYETIRLAGIDTPEVRGEEHERGLAAKARTEELVLDRPVVITTTKDPQTFGRYVARVAFEAEAGSWKDLGERLIAEGYAVPSHG